MLNKITKEKQFLEKPLYTINYTNEGNSHTIWRVIG